MMVELPRNAIEKGQWGQVRRRIQTFRYHPGLLCWGSEERVARGLDWLNRNQVRETGQWMAWSLNKERDPATDIGKFMSDAATGFAVLSLAAAR